MEEIMHCLQVAAPADWRYTEVDRSSIIVLCSKTSQKSGFFFKANVLIKWLAQMIKME